MNVKEGISKLKNTSVVLKKVVRKLPGLKNLRLGIPERAKSSRELTPTLALAEMGTRLREHREQQNLSLEEVADRTMIPVRLLGAIENAKLEQLPEPVYIQGMLRRFADALGLNGAAFAREFPTGIEIQPKQMNWRDSPAAQLRPIHLYLLYIFLIVFSVRSLSYSIEQSRVPENPSSAPQELPKTTLASDTQQKPPSTPPTPNIVATASREGSDSSTVRVGVTVTEASWVLVEADGEVAFEGMLSEGTHSWEAKEQLTISAGNAGGILITHNGSEAEKMGERGAVEEVTFRAPPPS
ncbi:helix-turn-helix domain-containing protein [Oscillatoriales cyanobacterium LEGE 11467]|uniref:Helix-turn-helix domain-containing protein n=1 Tax=Zarconia navalis LEGE 11467 TaxID=1828826 RepID=A0A928VYA2_9CYAN|nr:RodZ domain-containing protein [Zarconia navalis]MBE9039900.1 helix-turn-helix domain-containing protein [Zarconia navalis LEGE 11467]